GERRAAGHVDRSHAAAGRRLLIATGLGDHVRISPNDRAPGRSRTIAPRSRIGIGAVLPAAAATLPPGELLMAVARAGYCGVVRLEDGRIDVAAAVDRHALASAAPATLLRHIVRDACGTRTAKVSLDGLDAVEIRATPALTRSAPLIEGKGRCIMRLGDAAGYVEPFTGEGMGWALAAGRLAAEALVDPATGALMPATVATDRYGHAHARHFRPRHARCRRVAGVLRLPRLVRLAVRAAQLAPWAARLAVPAVIGAQTTIRRENHLATGAVS
ncbi:MAG: NAD(P)/FAD-dependent oxidoreductase, partial [Planctomycetia bacterium]